MADGPSDCKRSRYEQSPDWTQHVFELTSLTKRYPAFAILQLGPDCNAHTSASFTEAKCNFKKLGRTKGVMYTINFDDIFSKGIDLLFDLKNDTRNLNEDEQRAVDILYNFLEGKDKHEQSLIKVIEKCKNKERSNSLETDLTVAFAEHLLGRLAPGKSCVIDRKKEGTCKCGLEHCIGKPVFESTGIGDERAWHGFIDTMFSSHPVATVTYTGSEATDDEEDSPGGKTICEMKLLAKKHGLENHAIAQTIAFSYIQRKRHPNFKHFLIPNILISPFDYRLLMYDSENDILICSVKVPIFQERGNPEELNIESVVFLWMVLHYNIFCVGINVQEILNFGLIRDLKEIQSNFPERAGDKLDMYTESASKIGISRFRPVLDEELPSLEDMLFGEGIFKPRQLLNNSSRRTSQS